MALSKSGKADSNVTNLDDARRMRSRNEATPVEDVTMDDCENSVDVQTKAHQLPSPAATGIDTNVQQQTQQRSKVGNRRFDKEKVDKIKAEIANGTYEIDYFRVADKYIEHERFT